MLTFLMVYFVNIIFGDVFLDCRGSWWNGTAKAAAPSTPVSRNCSSYTRTALGDDSRGSMFALYSLSEVLRKLHLYHNLKKNYVLG